MFTTGTLIQVKFHTVIRCVKCKKKKKILFWLKEEEEWCQALPPHALQLSVPWIAWSQRRVLLKVSLVLAWLASSYLGKSILHPSFTKLESAGTGSGGLCLSNNLWNSQTCWTLRTGHGSTWQLPGDISIQEKLLFLWEVLFFLSLLQKYSWNRDWYSARSINIQWLSDKSLNLPSV